jgi:tripeptide aminopeptidase
MTDEKRIVQQFIDLVSIDSETTEEREIANYLIKILEEYGLTVEEDNTNELTNHAAGNLIAKLPGNKNRDAILFTSHMDTVTPGKSITPIVKDGYIMTDGTTILGADDKAGIAAILETIQIIQEEKLEHGDLYFVIMTGEESGLVGSRHIDINKLPVKYGYALDSDGNVGNIVNAAPAQNKLYATIKGKSAHAGVSPEKGVSAISITAKAISKMPLGRIDEETTANIGSFEGKGPTNIVCDKVLLVAEARSISKQKLEQQTTVMVEALEKTATAMGGTVSIKIEEMYPSYQFSKDDYVVTQAMRATTSIGLTPKLVTSGGGSDANHLSGKGIPTVNLAIGYENIHTTNEKIQIEQLITIPKLMLSIIKNSN